MPGGERAEFRQRRDRRVEVGEQHDEAAPARVGQDRGRQQAAVGFGEFRVQGRHRVGDRREGAGAGRRQDAGADLLVGGDQVDPVAGLDRQGGQQLHRVHGRVQPRVAPDAPGRRAPGVEDEHDAAVALGAPGPDEHVPPARGRPPVDGPDVVADHVLAQAVELAALSRPHRPVLPVELAELRQLAGQVLAAAERRQRPDRVRALEGPLAGREAQRPERPDGDGVAAEVAAPLRVEGGGDARLACCCYHDGGAGRDGPGRRGPGGADLAPQRPGARVEDGGGDGRALAEADPRVTGPGELERPDRGGEEQVGDDRGQQRRVDDHQRGGRPEREDEQDGGEGDGGGSAAQGHSGLTSGPGRSSGCRPGHPRG